MKWATVKCRSCCSQLKPRSSSIQKWAWTSWQRCRFFKWVVFAQTADKPSRRWQRGRRRCWNRGWLREWWVLFASRRGQYADYPSLCRWNRGGAWCIWGGIKWGFHWRKISRTTSRRSKCWFAICKRGKCLERWGFFGVLCVIGFGRSWLWVCTWEESLLCRGK